MVFYKYHVIVPRGVCHVIPDFTVLIKKKIKKRKKKCQALGWNPNKIVYKF